ncbi:hypothetical protein A3F58_02410 [Candidatus Roizmanbacteria bacterium RIFCSPHIGHO2_12_FULL_37_9b]|uniref:Uncharacterized protein n=1 Tax=Candidatus Roizmanbacteria bacterium RIFCSPHIGHO2_02_FULL_38_11 TaxID=1802039 RepID=A0A1F7H215_9BACT|nr:MAG: hypothetical protein A3C25_00625 [Candidatus Roizmanbacteria bacterium RIFCSPHIGHO2_02_FULL_38_11]OGK34605.1 MAG: hypothetical protein A3F58_02410 [Candidatus Roizmanbacteria bacterium RIFCSPHIGHO2_12_FULL_37_9b]
MRKIILNKDQVLDLVWNNRYKVEDEQKFLSRCVDGRYENKIKNQKSKVKTEDTINLPPLAIPGADAGQLGIIFATANTYGFEVDKEKVFELVVDVVGGIENFSFHSDHHGDPKIPASGCGHIKQQNLDPKAYGLEDDQMKFIETALTKAKKKGAKEIVLEGEHQEGAILQINGPYSLYPGSLLETDQGNAQVQVFIFHSTLVNERHRLIAKKLIEKKAVELFPGCDEEYLYEVLSEVTESHLFETLKRLASGLSMFQVNFESDGSFDIKEMGKL